MLERHACSQVRREREGRKDLHRSDLVAAHVTVRASDAAERWSQVSIGRSSCIHPSTVSPRREEPDERTLLLRSLHRLAWNQLGKPRHRSSIGRRSCVARGRPHVRVDQRSVLVISPIRLDPPSLPARSGSRTQRGVPGRLPTTRGGNRQVARPRRAGSPRNQQRTRSVSGHDVEPMASAETRHLKLRGRGERAKRAETSVSWKRQVATRSRASAQVSG